MFQHLNQLQEKTCWVSVYEIPCTQLAVSIFALSLAFCTRQTHPHPEARHTEEAEDSLRVFEAIFLESYPHQFPNTLSSLAPIPPTTFAGSQPLILRFALANRLGSSQQSAVDLRDMSICSLLLRMFTEPLAGWTSRNHCKSHTPCLACTGFSTQVFHK